jgi:hypothetical protein
MKLYLNIAMNGGDEKDQCSAFLYIIGQEGREIFNTMTVRAEDVDKIEVLFQKFKNYCAPCENITVWRHKFNARIQGKTECIDQYVTDLRIIWKNCKFGALEEEMLRDRIGCGVFSEKVKERLLRHNELTFKKAISACRSNEESQSRLKDLQHDEQVHAVRVKKQTAKSSPGSKNTPRPKHNAEKQSTPKPQPESKSTTFACRKCGNKHGRM